MARHTSTKPAAKKHPHQPAAPLAVFYLPAGPFKQNVLNLLVMLLFLTGIIVAGVLFFRPLDTTAYFDCPGNTDAYTPPKHYYRQLFGDTDAYHQAVNDAPTYPMESSTTVPDGCTRRSFSLYLF